MNYTQFEVLSKIKRPFALANLMVQGNTLQYLKRLERLQFAPLKDCIGFQKSLLRYLLGHAYENVPYYQKTFQNIKGFKPSYLTNPDFISDIPLLDKSDITSNFQALQAQDNHKRLLHKNSSGGSTGEPVTIIQDKVYSNWSEAVKLLFDKWSGHLLSDRKIRLWGSIRDLAALKDNYKLRLLKWLYSEVHLNSFKMTPREMSKYILTINKFRPNQILSYSESIYELANYIISKGENVYSPNAIMTSAGTLFPNMRETIQHAFKCPVFNRYGSREVGDIACECEKHTGLHISIPTHYVETLKPDGSNAGYDELGEIVITSLVNFAMPLMRYRIGDMGVLSRQRCSCGRTWPVLKEIAGRVTDVFRRQDGGVVAPEFFIHLIGVELNSGWIQKFQVIQKQHKLLQIRIIPTTDPQIAPEEHNYQIEQITKGIQMVMGNDCKVDYRFETDIPPTASGKHRYTISEIGK